MELMYSKGIRFYEDEPVYRSTLDDIDMDFVGSLERYDTSVPEHLKNFSL